MSYQCKICDNISDFKEYTVREMQLGLRENFLYQYCNECDSLQISEFPGNLAKYYPDKDYYSFSSIATKNILYSLYSTIVSKSSFNRKGIFFPLVKKFDLYDYSLLSIGKINPPKHWRIADIGSGAGQLLYMLQKFGYKNLTGIDPYVTKSEFPIEIKKINISELADEDIFDLIMFHHSFEHTADPVVTLLTAKKHISDDGIILIRTPLISEAFKKYKEYWFQLDAPRHLHLQSLKSIKLMIERAGLKLLDIYCDSRDEQFYVSENYKNDISIKEAKKTPLSSLFSVLFSEKRSKYRKEARLLNQQMAGDTVVYYVTK